MLRSPCHTKSVLVIIAIIFLSIAHLNQFAHACSCTLPPSPMEALEKADAVFLGKVVEIKKGLSNIVSSAQPIPVKFDVQKVWKGPVEKTITVSTALSSASCGYDFEDGKTYLVYAYGEESLQTGLCTRTKLFADAYEDLHALGTGIIPISDGSDKICLGVSHCPDPREEIQKSEDFQNLLVVAAIGIPAIGMTIGFIVWNRKSK